MLTDQKYEMLCTIWYYFYNLKNVKNTHEGVLLLVKCSSRFLNCINGTKSRKTLHMMIQSMTFLNL